MAETTEIAWADMTLNPWIGCTKVSPGCAACYAEELDSKRFSKTLGGASKENPVSHWGKGAPRYRTSASNWKKPLRWNKDAGLGLFRECPECGWRGVVQSEDQRCETKGCMRLADTMTQVRPRVFCASLADWLDDEVPIEWLADLLELIHATPNLSWLMLSKRPENWLPRLRLVLTLVDKAATGNGAPAKRVGSVRISEIRGTGNRSGGPNLETSEANLLPMAERREDHGLQASQGGDEEWDGVSSSEGNASVSKSLCIGSPIGVDTFQSADSSGDNYQPQERDQVRQFPGQSGIGKLQRATASCNPAVRSEACGCQGREASENQISGRGCLNDASPSSAGPNGEGDRCNVSDEAESSKCDHMRHNLAAPAFVAWLRAWLDGNPPNNIWLGTTVENQAMADKRIPVLLGIPAKVRFLSCEPLLGPVSLFAMDYIGTLGGAILCPSTRVTGAKTNRLAGIDWLIGGFESGPKARPGHPLWARSLRDQCGAAQVNFLWKQWGEFAECNMGNCEAKEHRFVEFDGTDSTHWSIFDHSSTTAHMVRVGKKTAGRLLDRRQWNEFPEVAQ